MLHSKDTRWSPLKPAGKIPIACGICRIQKLPKASMSFLKFRKNAPNIRKNGPKLPRKKPTLKPPPGFGWSTRSHPYRSAPWRCHRYSHVPLWPPTAHQHRRVEQKRRKKTWKTSGKSKKNLRTTLKINENCENDNETWRSNLGFSGHFWNLSPLAMRKQITTKENEQIQYQTTVSWGGIDVFAWNERAFPPMNGGF